MKDVLSRVVRVIKKSLQKHLEALSCRMLIFFVTLEALYFDVKLNNYGSGVIFVSLNILS